MVIPEAVTAGVPAEHLVRAKELVSGFFLVKFCGVLRV